MNTSIITYTPPESNIVIELTVDIDQRIVWATQRQLADALNLSIPSVSEQITNFKKQRGDKANRSIRKVRIVAEDGKNREVEQYDMTVVAFVGFRAQATEKVLQFQDWVGEQLDKAVAENKPKALSNLDALEYIVSELRATDNRMKALEAKSTDLYEAHGNMALDIENINVRLLDADYFTVLQFCQRQGINVATSVRSQWGVEAKALSRERGIEVKSTIEGRFSVGRYYKDILLEVCVVKPKKPSGQLTLLDDDDE